MKSITHIIPVADEKVIYLDECNPIIGFCGHKPSQGSLKIFGDSEKLDVILVLWTHYVTIKV